MVPCIQNMIILSCYFCFHWGLECGHSTCGKHVGLCGGQDFKQPIEPTFVPWLNTTRCMFWVTHWVPFWLTHPLVAMLLVCTICTFLINKSIIFLQWSLEFYVVNLVFLFLLHGWFVCLYFVVELLNWGWFHLLIMLGFCFGSGYTKFRNKRPMYMDGGYMYKV